MPYVMIPAFHRSAQALQVTSDPQLSMPLQPIPCKPGKPVVSSTTIVLMVCVCLSVCVCMDGRLERGTPLCIPSSWGARVRGGVLNTGRDEPFETVPGIQDTNKMK